MIIRRYEPETDYAEVKALVEKTMPRNLPERLGGVGVVIKEDSKIVAFCWALTSKDSDISCVEFFAVDPEYRNKKKYGPMVILNLLMELRKEGAMEVIGLLVEGETYTNSLCRIYNEVGMVTNKGYVVNGFIDKILDGIRKRYMGGI